MSNEPLSQSFALREEIDAALADDDQVSVKLIALQLQQPGLFKCAERGDRGLAEE